MEKANSTLSPVCKKRLYIQGYQNYSDKELNDYKYGIRFAYALCTTLAGLGLVFNSIPLLIVAAAVALASTMLPYHPFDYLYNYVVRHLFSKPRIPHRTAQGRFACDVAFVWLTTIILFFYNGHFITGKILGGHPGYCGCTCKHNGYLYSIDGLQFSFQKSETVMIALSSKTFL